MIYERKVKANDDANRNIDPAVCNNLPNRCFCPYSPILESRTKKQAAVSEPQHNYSDRISFNHLTITLLLGLQKVQIFLRQSVLKPAAGYSWLFDNTLLS